MVPLCSLSGQGSAGALRRQVSQGHLAAAETGLAAESRSGEEAVLSNDGTAAEVGLQSYGRRAWVRECPSASACVWLRAWGTLSTAGRRVLALLQRPLLAASEVCLGSPARLIADALSAPAAGVASVAAASVFGSLQPASERLWARCRPLWQGLAAQRVRTQGYRKSVTAGWRSGAQLVGEERER